MPAIQVNVLAVLVAAVLSIALGAVWYSPALFARQWMAPQLAASVIDAGYQLAYLLIIGVLLALWR